MKKFLIALLVLVLAVSLVACGNNGEENGGETPEPSEPSGEKTTLNFAVQADSTPALDKIVEEFNKKSEKYEVKTTIMTNDSGQMHDQL